MIASHPNRRFPLWEYKVSHGSLLIRSPKSPEESTNIDLVFDGVEYVNCPRMLRGLDLLEGSPDEVEAFVGEIRVPDRVFVLVSGGARRFVVASSCRIDEHDRDIFDSPFA